MFPEIFCPLRGGQEKKMSKKLYVGNLPFSVTEEQLREMFGEYGTVEEVNLITDRETGRSRGFAFVEMTDGYDEAIEALHQKDMDGRNLKVNEARPREDRPPRRQRW
jgi:cold-inducible RNA-binding protein